MKTARIYGKTINEWYSTDDHGRVILTQKEIAYSEYYENGELRATGTEDFSLTRLHSQTKQRWVSTWDGLSYNRGGHRQFEGRGPIRYSGEASVVKTVLTKRYPKALVVELRA